MTDDARPLTELLLRAAPDAETGARQLVLDPTQLRCSPSADARADAFALLNDPAVRASPLFVHADASAQRRELLDLDFRTVGMLADDAAATVHRLLATCAAATDEALRVLGRELGVGAQLERLASRRQHRLRIIRVLGDGASAVPMAEHVDHSLLSMHIPIAGDEDSAALWWHPAGCKRVDLPHRPLLMCGAQLELVSGGRLIGARHGSASSLPRAALVFFAEVDEDALLAPLLPPLAPPAAGPAGATGCQAIVELARRRGADGAPMSAAEYHLALLDRAAQAQAQAQQVGSGEGATTGGMKPNDADLSRSRSGAQSPTSCVTTLQSSPPMSPSSLELTTAPEAAPAVDVLPTVKLDVGQLRAHWEQQPVQGATGDSSPSRSPLSLR